MSAPRKGLNRAHRPGARQESRHVIAEADDAAIVLVLFALMLAARQLGDIARQRLVHRVGVHGDRRVGCAFLGGRMLRGSRTGRLTLRLAMLFRFAVFFRPVLRLCCLYTLFARGAVRFRFAASAAASASAATPSTRRFLAFA